MATAKLTLDKSSFFLLSPGTGDRSQDLVHAGQVLCHWPIAQVPGFLS